MKFQRFSVDSTARRTLRQKLLAGPPVLRFADDPALAALCTCLGLKYEVGRPGVDRLSPFFGRTESAWESELILDDVDVGIRWRPSSGQRLEVRHGDFRHILDAQSFDRNGDLTSVVIFPTRVARNYAALGFDLVVVRDWFVASVLNEGEARVDYLHVNAWEVRAVIARQQAALMQRRQLAFTGTHDIVDHLLGADCGAFDSNRALVERAAQVLDEVFSLDGGPYVMAYLLAVVLDDLAQPRWYRSMKHRLTADDILARLAAGPFQPWHEREGLPPAFQQVVESLRSPLGDAPSAARLT